MICCIMGNLGAGKTLLATLFAASAARAGVRVYANFPLYFDYERLYTYERLQQVSSGLLVLDELQFLMEARDFSKNVDLVHWAVLLRKLGLDLIYTTQHFEHVDKRIRQITDYVLMASAAGKVSGRKRSKVVLVNMWPAPHVVKSFLFVHDPRLYALYDTYDRDVLLT